MFPQLLHLPHFSFVLILAGVVATITNASMARRSGVSERQLVILGLAIVLALGYWLLFSVFLAIGRTGLLSPALAAWTPNIIVVGCAIYLLLTART